MSQLHHLINLTGSIPAIMLAGHHLYGRFKTNRKNWTHTMHKYIPVGGTINAGTITKLTTTATLDDNSTVEIPAGYQVGDYVIQNPSGSVTVDAKADFESKYIPA